MQKERHFDDEKVASIKADTKRFKRMRIEDAGKKLRSKLSLAGNEGEMPLYFQVVRVCPSPGKLQDVR